MIKNDSKMLNYNDKEAKNFRVEIRKQAQDLRSRTRSTSYPSVDVRETVSDIYEWAKKEGNLYPALRRAYDLDMHILFDIEDNAEASFLTEDQLDLAEDINVFCVMCRKLVRAGGLHPDKAYKLHDGSFCPARESRVKKGNRRLDDNFNRDFATKDDVAAFKAAQREKRYEEYKEATAANLIAQVEFAAGVEEYMTTLVDTLNADTASDNFTLDNAGTMGGNICIIQSPNGKVYSKAYDYPNVTMTDNTILGFIYIKQPMVYGPGFAQGTSYIDVVYPILDRKIDSMPNINIQ